MFKYNYVDELKGEANFFNEMGSLAHLIFELNDKGKITDCGKAWETGYIKRVRGHEQEWYESWYMDCYSFFKSWNGHEQEATWIEEHSVSDFGDFLFQGYVDRLHLGEKGFVITDYKVSKPFLKKDIVKKRRQLYLYSLFVKEKLGEYPAELSFFFFRQNKKLNFDFNKSDYNEAKDWAKRTFERIQKEEELLIKDGNDYFCSSVCSFRNICEKR